MWELYAMWAWFAVFFGASLAAEGEGSASGAALATFAVIGIGGIGCWVGGLLGDRWGRTSTTALMMALSALCALTIGLLFDGPTWLLLAVGLVWGFTVVADSAQFSTMVTELADQAYVGTALTLQLALGFTLDGGDDLADPGLRGRDRLALGLRVPRPRAPAGHRRDAAPARLTRGEADRRRQGLK